MDRQGVPDRLSKRTMPHGTCRFSSSLSILPCRMPSTMRICLFYHSLLSDWNHGNAHFLRGIAVELQSRGHDVRIFEPENGWSLRNLVAEHGEAPLRAFHDAYPSLQS